MKRTLLSITASLAVLISPVAQAQDVRTLTEEVNLTYGLAASQVLPVLWEGSFGEAITATIVLEGGPVTLQLQPQTVRAPGFQLMVQGADGSLVATTPEVARTLRGVVLEIPGSQVAASLLDDGLYARIRLAGGTELWLQPLMRDFALASADQHVLYAGDAVLDVNRPCGTDGLSGPFSGSMNLDGGQFSGGGGGGGGGGVSIAELGVDSDFEYYSRYGSVGATTNRIEAVINSMNLQYEGEVDITHVITSTIVRTSSNQPYTSTDAVTLLNQFKAEWLASQGGVVRDTAHLFTGKEVNGGTIGIAWVGVICNISYGYGVVQSDFNNNFSCATDLSAHELGHNWSANHCQCTSNTMNPYITCANTFHPNLTIPEIASHRDSRNCLDQGGGGTATEVTVASITASSFKASKGRKFGRAVVLVCDDQGAAISGATVEVTFSGSFNEVRSGTTGADGTVTITTAGTAKGKVNITACATDVTGTVLPWDGVVNCD